ncbi:hypothetical protein [Lyngbya sp. PCC 8106]|nr:hypothetical protein [Lyngbya sp. PCC 8106]
MLACRCSNAIAERVVQIYLFRDQDVVRTPTFPELNLTAEQIFAVGP